MKFKTKVKIFFDFGLFDKLICRLFHRKNKTNYFRKDFLYGINAWGYTYCPKCESITHHLFDLLKYPENSFSLFYYDELGDEMIK